MASDQPQRPSSPHVRSSSNGYSASRVSGWLRNLVILVASTGVLLGLQGLASDRTASAPESTWEDQLAPLADNEKEAIQTVLQQQVQAWNQGDIGQFMTGYWNSPNLTFASGGGLTRGWQATHDRYVRRYDTRDKMGNLRFDHLEFQSVSNDAALVLGQWHLTDAQKNLMEGNFSLVFKKFPSGWKIIHDHTSLKPEDTAPSQTPTDSDQ